MTSSTFPSSYKSIIFGFFVCCGCLLVQMCASSLISCVWMCVCIWWYTHSPLAVHFAEVTPFQKNHSVKCCVTLLYLRGDRRQRPLLKLTLCEPGCQCYTHARMHAGCSWLGCAAQSKWISSRLIWLVPVAICDWDDKAMTSTSLTAAEYNLPITQIEDAQSSSDGIIFSHLIMYTLYASKARNCDQENSHKQYPVVI